MISWTRGRYIVVLAQKILWKKKRRKLNLKTNFFSRNGCFWFQTLSKICSNQTSNLLTETKLSLKVIFWICLRWNVWIAFRIDQKGEKKLKRCQTQASYNFARSWKNKQHNIEKISLAIALLSSSSAAGTMTWEARTANKMEHNMLNTSSVRILQLKWSAVTSFITSFVLIWTTCENSSCQMFGASETRFWKKQVNFAFNLLSRKTFIAIVGVCKSYRNIAHIFKVNKHFLQFL